MFQSAVLPYAGGAGLRWVRLFRLPPAFFGFLRLRARPHEQILHREVHDQEQTDKTKRNQCHCAPLAEQSAKHPPADSAHIAPGGGGRFGVKKVALDRAGHQARYAHQENAKPPSQARMRHMRFAQQETHAADDEQGGHHPGHRTKHDAQATGKGIAKNARGTETERDADNDATPHHTEPPRINCAGRWCGCRRGHLYGRLCGCSLPSWTFSQNLPFLGHTEILPGWLSSEFSGRP